MRYQGSITIPAGTPASAPVIQAVELCFGTIAEVRILHPRGCAGLVHVTVWYHERQIYPTTPGESFLGDGDPNVFTEHWPIHEVPHEVELRGWSPDAEYDHTVYVEFSMLEPVTYTVGGLQFISIPEES